MVAASKMRKAQQAALAGRPYATLMNEVLGEVSFNAGDFSHPLMEKREDQRRAVILVSTDKGLCGGLNSNLMREAVKFVETYVPSWPSLHTSSATGSTAPWWKSSGSSMERNSPTEPQRRPRWAVPPLRAGGEGC